MRHIQTYRLFETSQTTASQTLTQDQKNFLDRYTDGTWSLNPTTGLVDVDGDFDCSDEYLKDFLGVKFGAVSGNFDCDNNNLTSLAGAPETVGGHFDCDNNNLTSLAGAPETVGGHFDCDNNNLTSLAGAPETVGRYFHCDNNNLTSLVGAPETVGWDFHCDNNNLTSLEGAPQTIGGEFSSDGLNIPKGEWSMDTLIGIFLGGTAKQQQLLTLLVDPKVIQQRIDQNPEGMLVKLKDHLKHPHLQGLKWPQRLDQEKDLLADLSDIGL